MSLTLVNRPQLRHSTTDTLPADPIRAWLAHLPVADLPAFHPATLPTYPAGERHPVEVEAAARAAACPDLFVVHAPDHAAGERVIADIARVCGSPTSRVLILSPNPVAADRITERLVKLMGGGVVRALAEDENPVRSSPLVGRATSAAVVAARMEQLKREAAAAVAAVDTRLTALERLTELAEKTAKLDARAAEVTASRETVDAAVRAEIDTVFTAKLAALKAVQETEDTRVLAEGQAADVMRKEKETALETLRQHHAAAIVETAKKPGFFARLLGGGKHGPDPAALEKEIHAVESEIAALTAKVSACHAKVAASGSTLAAAREQATQVEIATRRAEFDSPLATLSAERQAIQGEIDAIGKNLGMNPPAAHELPGVCFAATRDLVTARERAAEMNRDTAAFARRSLAETPVVVGTPGSLYADPVFERRDPSAALPFALLILDRAEELAEPDFAQLAKWAERWVLLGDAPAEEPRPHLNGSSPRPGRNGRPVPAPIEVPFVARLARTLDRGTWVHEAERLVCRLSFPTAEQRRGMTREPLLDRPEIEVRFVADAEGEPLLAEVVFPAGTTVPAAKSFLFHQLGEVLLRPCGCVNWSHTPTALTATWPAAEHGHGHADGIWIDLEPGVREKVMGVGLAAFTAAVLFDLSAGWDAEKATAWLEENLPAPSAGRFAAVLTTSPTPRRPGPA